MANIVTCIRIVCALSLIFCPAFSIWYYLLYLVGGTSDILDGFLARHRGCVTALGSRLDTAADTLFTAVVLIKLYLSVYIPIWLTVWVICIAVIKCANVVCGFVLYRQFVAEHTVMNKICGILLFLIPPCIGAFPWQPTAILIILTCILSTFAAIQEGHFIRTGIFR